MRVADWGAGLSSTLGFPLLKRGGAADFCYSVFNKKLEPGSDSIRTEQALAKTLRLARKLASGFWTFACGQMQSGAQDGAPLAVSPVLNAGQPASATARCAMTLIRLAR
jgi:hypothetical protein